MRHAVFPLRRSRCAIGFVERNCVVAAVTEYLDRRGIGDAGLTAVDGHGAAVHENLSSRIAARHDGVIDVIDSKPALGKNLALKAMIVILSRIWPWRRCALAVNGVEP